MLPAIFQQSRRPSVKPEDRVGGSSRRAHRHPAVRDRRPKGRSGAAPPRALGRLRQGPPGEDGVGLPLHGFDRQRHAQVQQGPSETHQPDTRQGAARNSAHGVLDVLRRARLQRLDAAALLEHLGWRAGTFARPPSAPETRSRARTRTVADVFGCRRVLPMCTTVQTAFDHATSLSIASGVSMKSVQAAPHTGFPCAYRCARCPSRERPPATKNARLAMSAVGFEQHPKLEGT